MGIYASIISGVISTGAKLLGSSGGPQYPAPPTLNKINVSHAKDFMQNYEAQRMGASVDAWKSRFPLLYKGAQYLEGDTENNQHGLLSPNVKSAITSSGLETPVEGNQYSQAKDLGLSPMALAQRTSESATRQIAMNPEWTNQISGGTLATLLANNNKNQNAFSQFLGANQTAQYVAGQAADANTTRVLLSGLTGSAAIGAQAYQNQRDLSLGNYYQGNIYGRSTPMASEPSFGYSSNPPQVNTGPTANINYANSVPSMDSSNPSSSPYGNYYDFYNQAGQPSYF